MLAPALVMLVTARDAGAFHAPTHDLAVTPSDVLVLGADAFDKLSFVAAGDFNGDGIDGGQAGTFSREKGRAGT